MTTKFTIPLLIICFYQNIIAKQGIKWYSLVVFICYSGGTLIRMKKNLIISSIELIKVSIIAKKAKENENKVDDINEEIY